MKKLPEESPENFQEEFPNKSPRINGVMPEGSSGEIQAKNSEIKKELLNFLNILNSVLLALHLLKKRFEEFLEQPLEQFLEEFLWNFRRKAFFRNT